MRGGVLEGIYIPLRWLEGVLERTTTPSSPTEQDGTLLKLHSPDCLNKKRGSVAANELNRVLEEKKKTVAVNRRGAVKEL